MAVLAILFSGIFLIVSIIYVYFKTSYSFFDNEGVPHLKPSFPFGNIKGMGSKFHMVDFLNNLYRELKEQSPIVGFYNLAEPVYLVTDLELIKNILVKNFNNFVNRGEVLN